ncbi:GntR family transcriptional regulator [Thermoplasma acidophilum]|uniref:GntR family transcriptional regulator n=1 Tax=Thermoplasma acidophilum TaxID=2303 RepID=UPI00068DB837|nr:GntR family transcriptional regulator [Thermoplasma acidophilum]
MLGDLIITIDPNSQTPLYRQIYSQIVGAIATGRLLPGDRLPSLRVLAGLLDVNYHTVNEAYEMLRQEGFITLMNRKKYIVSPRKPDDEKRKRVLEDLHESVIKAAALGISYDEIYNMTRKFFNGEDAH